MSQEEYAALSVLDCFSAAFPNTVTIDELTAEEKVEYICAVVGEYGFTINKEGFTDSRYIETAPLDKIETAVRTAVVRKLTAKDDSFCLDITDIDTKVKKIRKVSALAELESLIGLDGVKMAVKEIVTFLKKRGRASLPCLHMVFTGNPGTGKTTVARVIARVFAETGVTKKNLLVETDREGLVGGYIGQTALKTKSRIESALGGVLFIDEAYSLFAGSDKDYGHEAVSTLVKAMEDKRDEFVCILAGYTQDMNAMLDMNPGLRDRVQFYIDFPDYSESELLQIFERLCKDNKYRLSQSAADVLVGGFSRIVRAKSENFSNGRLARKLFERVRMKQALRTSTNVITDVDIRTVFAEPDIAAMMCGGGRVRIGFGE
jgi:SpoVK/Ycf46/Vps4 family AAA+-type ATPase